MKSLLLGAMMMIAMTINPAFAKGDNADVSAIKTVMESMATMADRNAYYALENVFDDEVVVDYTSLGGGEIEVKSNTALMTAWAGLLPGFERTRHTLTDLQVELNGDKATGSSHVTAEHWVDGLFWSVTGTYDYGFRKKDGQWRISKLTLNFVSETGTRDVFAVAMGHAAEYPVPYVSRQKNRQLVIDFLSALENKDKSQFASLWAEDAVQDLPFAEAPDQRRLAGKVAILNAYDAWFAKNGKQGRIGAVTLHPMRNAEEIYVEFDADGGILGTMKEGKQKYATLFHMVDGKVSFFRAHQGPALMIPANHLGDVR